jgi:hypothetical protein
MDAHGGQDEIAKETSDETSEVWGPRRDYLSYLVRLWRVGHSGEERWRASLQRPGTAEPIWFAGLEDMLAFLRAETGTSRVAEPPRQ